MIPRQEFRCEIGDVQLPLFLGTADATELERRKLDHAFAKFLKGNPHRCLQPCSWNPAAERREHNS